MSLTLLLRFERGGKIDSLRREDPRGLRVDLRRSRKPHIKRIIRQFIKVNFPCIRSVVQPRFLMITRQGGISTRCYVERSFVKFHIVSVRCFQAFENSLNLQKNRRRKCKMLSVRLKPHIRLCLQVLPSQGFLCIEDGKIVLKESLSKR